MSTILKANSTAVFLAALPQLLGFTAPGSAYVVIFKGKRTEGVARIDLPAMASTDAADEWITAVAHLASAADSVALVFHTEEALTQRPEAHPYSVLASLTVDLIKKRTTTSVRDAAILGADGWTALATDPNTLRDYSEITASPLYSPAAGAATLGAWQSAHPENTGHSIDEARHLVSSASA